MKKKFCGFYIISMLCAFLVISTFAFSGVLAVKNITLQLPGTFYYVNNEFVLNANGTADVQVYGAPVGVYDYTVENLNVTISGMDIEGDYSSILGQAKGEFYGGGVLTITGELYAKDSAGNPTGPILDSGVMLQADMNLSGSETWTLEEQFYYASNIVQSETLYLSPSGTEGLAVGLSAGDDTMIIGDMNLTMQFITPGINEFGTDDWQAAEAPAIQLSAEIPEPATMLLLTFGSVLVSMRKKK
jgi:hypothetical protein